MTNKKYPKVSIIFPNHNGGTEPLECLSSIYKLDYPHNRIEVIVIDNNSSDDSPKRIKKMYPKIKLIFAKENLGFARAINLASTLASGEYLFIGNDDLVFDKQSLAILVNYSIKNPQAGILGGKIYYKNAKQTISSAGFMMNSWTGNIYSAENPEQEKEPNWVQGCALFVSKETFNEVGKFDEQFSQIYFEDFDLCLKVKKKGYQIVYLPQAVFWHGVTLTANKNMVNKYYQWYKNKVRFIIKNMAFLQLVSILFVQIALVTPYQAFVLRDRRPTPFLRGLWFNLTHIMQTLRSRYSYAT